MHTTKGTKSGQQRQRVLETVIDNNLRNGFRDYNTESALSSAHIIAFPVCTFKYSSINNIYRKLINKEDFQLKIGLHNNRHIFNLRLHLTSIHI